MLAVRTTASAESLVQPLLAHLQAAQPDLPLTPALSGSEQINFTLFPQRLGAQIAAVLGGVCLLLAAIGLYGVLTLGAVRQMRDALGAQRGEVAARRLAPRPPRHEGRPDGRPARRIIMKPFPASWV